MDAVGKGSPGATARPCGSVGAATAESSNSIVRTEAVAYRYPQASLGLEPTSLALEQGEQALVTGASGSGKSTLARCLTGLIPHLYRGQLAGAVWIDEQRTTQAPLWQLAERAGLVFQNPAAQMLAESVEREIVFGLENLGLPPGEITQRLEETLARFDLGGMRARSPQTLSGGEQQKLALAAIMARRPPVLVLDEPLSMLDGTAALELVAHLGELVAEGTTAVVCEHRHEYFCQVAGLRMVPLGKGPAQAPETDTPPPLVPRLPVRLEVSALTVELGGRPVLSDVNLTANGGQVIAIVGRNGVGKTTLLRALAGLQAHEGRIATGDGQKPRLGLVFQNADLQLFNANVRDEILFRVRDPDLAFYEWLLAALGLAHYEHTPPLLLSEGEKKRVALATVLMRLPRDGILLDEPSLGQDSAHKAQLLRVARALAGTGRLVILTTHDLALATQADRLLLLGDDGFVADGLPAEVLEETGVWQAIRLAVPDWVRPAPGGGRATAWQREPSPAGEGAAT